MPFWQSICSWVSAGGYLYASVSAMSALSIPYAMDLFGVSLEDRLPWRSEVVIEFTEDFCGIAKGERFAFQAAPGLEYTGALFKMEGARVIARNQDGNPAFVIFDNGKGGSALCAYPIEMMLGITPNAFEGQSSYWKIYRALKIWASIQSAYIVTDPQVEVGVLTGLGRDYVILVNHSPDEKEGHLEVVPNIGKVEILTPQGRLPADLVEHGWAYQLEGFSGVVMEVFR